jgi:hypothetical protein
MSYLTDTSSNSDKSTNFLEYAVYSSFSYTFYEIKAATLFDGFSKIGGIISFTGIITFILSYFHQRKHLRQLIDIEKKRKNLEIKNNMLSLMKFTKIDQ